MTDTTQREAPTTVSTTATRGVKPMLRLQYEQNTCDELANVIRIYGNDRFDYIGTIYRHGDQSFYVSPCWGAPTIVSTKLAALNVARELYWNLTYTWGDPQNLTISPLS